MHVYVCAFVCVRVRERETDGVNVCMHVCEIEKVTKKTVIEGGNGGKRKIFRNLCPVAIRLVHSSATLI